MAEPVIQTKHLSRSFGDVLAVDDLTLDIYSGEVFGFLGPNGAGKTTTVRMLTALIAPSSGKAMVNGFQIGKADGDIRRSTGILTETPGLYNTLSAERNLQIYAQLYEVVDIEGQIEKYLQMLGLWERRHDTAGTFSKGMQQKLAIARALLHEPKVVFLDEPTSGLDPEAARLVRSFIEELRNQGRTIIICTHNLDEADRLCDRIGVFRTRMLVVDTPGKLRTSLYGRKMVFHLGKVDSGMVKAVEGQEYVREVQVVENKLLISLDDPELQNPAIVRLLVGVGADVQFVGELRRSLEDVYLQLVKKSFENE
jgi:ABC-2 type transport system ATP-binding protein